ncbi:MAG: hypothetical protein D6689_00170 [Deltaproteobacteria bacterium]|nr:MAG: hypothetical protein D6689_00170 [Deltaproteobacteria bacterium]
MTRTGSWVFRRRRSFAPGGRAVGRRAVAAAAAVVVACGSDASPRAPVASSPAASARPGDAPAIGSGPQPAYARRIPFDLAVRPAALVRVPGSPSVAVSGVLPDGRLALALVDVAAARVVWTDARWCNGQAVHATADVVVCASGKGVRAVRVADGAFAWSSPRPFRAAAGDRVLAGSVVVDAATGRVVRAAAGGVDLADARALCPDGTVYAWRGGQLSAFDERLARRWSVDAADLAAGTDGGQAVVAVDCGAPAIVALAGAAGARSLIAVDPATGARTGGPIAARGWWPAPAGDGVIVADTSGIAMRDRTLGERVSLSPIAAAGPLVAAGDGLAIARAAAGTVVAVDAHGIRAWLAAPAAPRVAVVVGERMAAAGRAGRPPEHGDRLSLWQLPPPAPRPPAVPPLSPPAVDVSARPVDLPAPTPAAAATVFPAPDRGRTAAGPIAVAGGRVFAASFERRPAADYGAALSAFDLRARRWVWHADAACAPGAAVVAVAAGDGVVVCATRAPAGAADVAAVDAGTGALRWRRALPAIDAVAVGGGVVVARYGDRAVAVDARTGRDVRAWLADNGVAPRVVPAPAGPVAVEVGGVVAGDGWRLRARGYVARLAAADRAALVALHTGEVFAVDAATGAPVPAPAPVAIATIGTAGDRWYDRPAADVVRLWAVPARLLGAWRFPHAVAVAPHRDGSGAPIVLVDGWRAGQFVELDPDTGAIRGAHAWPADAVRDGVFSAVVDGRPIAGIVRQRPLSVHLFPR